MNMVGFPVVVHAHDGVAGSEGGVGGNPDFVGRVVPNRGVFLFSESQEVGSGSVVGGVSHDFGPFWPLG